MDWATLHGVAKSQTGLSNRACMHMHGRAHTHTHTGHLLQAPLCCFNFPGGSDSKASAHKVGDLGSIPGLGRSLEKEMCCLKLCCFNCLCTYFIFPIKM